MVRVVRKRLLGFTTVASCGPIPLRQLGLEQRPLDRKFMLIGANGTRVGKIHLEISADYEESDLLLYTEALHQEVLAKLSKAPEAPMTPHFVLSEASSSRDRTEMTERMDVIDGGIGGFDDPSALGYMMELGDDGLGNLGGLEDDIHSRWSADSFKSSLDESEESIRFPWVLAPTAFQLQEAIVNVQRSWKRITATADIGKMVSVFYATAAKNPRVGALFAHVDMAAQKEKLAGALSLVLENLHDSSSVLQALRDMAIRHVDYGVELDHYNDIGSALVACLVDADPTIETDASLNFSWRLAYTMIATTMMEAARPLYQKRGALPPGLELLGGDGAFPPLYYEFNERFQNAVSEIWREDGNDLAWQQLADVCDDFEACAQNLGRIIISEQFCVEKTIQPLKGAGGMLGGVKYCKQGVFFKFGIPDGKFILTNEAAQKVAGHELKNSSSYFQANIEGLHLPLVHLIDYAGFRLCATSLLPINTETLAVGTNNGGKDVHARDGKLLKLLQKAGEFLNIAQHAVGSFVLPSAADIEGHYSVTDGRRYVIDFSRAFPCDIESVRSSNSTESPYVRMLRPELVMRNLGQPLNPDAFSGFRGTGGASDTLQYEADCEAVKTASKKIRQCCKGLVEVLEAIILGECNPADFCDSLSRIFHFHGVNMRYLGLVARLAQSQELEVILRAEMCARIAKRRLRRCWREMLQSNGGYGIVSHLKRVAADFLSSLLAKDETF